MIKTLRIVVAIFAATSGVAFSSPEAPAKVQAKVVKSEGDLALLLSPQYVIEGAPVAQCKIFGLVKPCYLLRKAEKVQGPRK